MPSSNKLKHESSPYLLQHANNPVHWLAWNDEALQEAQKLDKPIILSIGYAACHWCHVMEHESFEDEEVARLMNENFVCIKVDREERPDVDQVYMDAIQAMGLNGGWPLNVFLMPNQKPFYGGTYFPKHNWLELLDKVAIAYQTSKDKLAESADNFANALNSKPSEQLHFQLADEFDFNRTTLKMAVDKLLKFVDLDNGGTLGAPKFPMPVIWEFLLLYYQRIKDKAVAKALEVTLNEMAKGGIYDQIGGGFSRYSVDDEWFAPHFEKMLYDNGQLISLYAKAANSLSQKSYSNIVAESIHFTQKDLGNGEGGYFSALDADSESIEGKFYTWTIEEWNAAIKQHQDLMTDYYSVTEVGNWEEGRNILYRNLEPEEFIESKQISTEAFEEALATTKAALLQIRDKRIPPATDDKVLCGWNALQLIGLCDAYKASGSEAYFELAKANYQFICNKLKQGQALFRNYKNGQASLAAYLEDYAFVIKAFIQYGEISNSEQPLVEAKDLTSYVLENFFDEEEKLFYYTNSQSTELIARKKEVFDNVIPSSNAIMAENLHWLAILFQVHEWKVLSDKMTFQLSAVMQKEPRYMSQWLSLYTLKSLGAYEVVIAGPEAAQLQLELWKNGTLGHCKVFVKPEDAKLSIFTDKMAIEQKNTFYVCENAACQQPVFSTDEVIKSVQL